jgi:hypothetical protein
MSLGVQNSGHLGKFFNYFGDFSFLLFALMTNNRCFLVITEQALCFGETRQVYHEHLIRADRCQSFVP